MTTTFSQQITSAGADAAIRWATMRRLEQQERRQHAERFDGYERRRQIAEARTHGRFVGLTYDRGDWLATYIDGGAPSYMLAAQHGGSEPMMHVIEVRS